MLNTGLKHMQPHPQGLIFPVSYFPREKPKRQARLNHKGLGKLPLYEAAYVVGPGGITWVKIFAGYVPQASQNPYPIKVYSVAKYIPHLIVTFGKM